jgi:hypothetical protein
VANTHKMILIGMVCVLLASCAGPGIQFRDEGDTIVITPVKQDGILSWLFGSSLPEGKYGCQFDEYKKAEADTKKDMKIVDINLNKNGN